MMQKTDLQCVNQYVEDGHVHYQLNHIKQGRCPECGSEDFFSSGHKHRTVIGYDRDRNRVFFEVDNPRWRCRNCGRTWYEPLTHRGIKWADSIAQTVAEDYVESGLSYGELNRRHGMSINAVIQLVEDYMAEAEGKQAYAFPETAGLERVVINGEAFYLLIDVCDFTILDILTKKDLTENVRDESVRNVVLTDERLIPLASAVFPEAEIFFHNLNLVEKGRNVLAREGEKLGLDRKEILADLKGPKETEAGKKKEASPEMFPIRVAWNFLLNNAGSPEKLRGYRGEISGFAEFCDGINDDEYPCGFDKFLMDEYDNGIMAIRNEASFYSGRPYQNENIKRLLLFNEDSHYPVAVIANPNNFGREMVRRVVTEKQGKR